MIESSLTPSEPVMLPSRPSRGLARSVMTHALAMTIMMLSPIVVFVPAALFHCALRNGRRAAWGSLVVALTLCAGYAAAVPAEPAAARYYAWVSVAGVALAVALPAMAALPLVERAQSFGRVLVFLVVASAVGLAVTELGARALLSFSPYDAQLQQAKLTNAGLIDAYRANRAQPAAIQFMQTWSDYSLRVLPGSMLMVMTLMFILSLMMIGRLPVWREWVAKRGEPAMAGTYFFRNLALPDWVLFAFILGGLTPLATGLLQKFAANTLAVVVFLYLLQGLAIFRFMLVAMSVSVGGTVLAWLLLGVLTLAGGTGLLLLGLAGLFDPFFDFRHFKKRKDDSDESHSD